MIGATAIDDVAGPAGRRARWPSRRRQRQRRAAPAASLASLLVAAPRRRFRREARVVSALAAEGSPAALDSLSALLAGRLLYRLVRQAGRHRRRRRRSADDRRCATGQALGQAPAAEFDAHRHQQRPAPRAARRDRPDPALQQATPPGASPRSRSWPAISMTTPRNCCAPTSTPRRTRPCARRSPPGSPSAIWAAPMRRARGRPWRPCAAA